MKRIFLAVTACCFAAGALHADGVAPAPKAAAQFKKYSMDHGYFSCLIPTAWTLEREKEKDAEYGIYEIQLLAPGAQQAPASVFVSYYSKNNEDFDGSADFIDRNSTNALGETKSERESYEPVKKIKLGVRKGFELAREKLAYLHPESKSEESVQLKEKLYVLPAKEGFYVLHFSAPAGLFAENLPVFEKIARSFKGKF
jgi:hypothetical protein